MGSVIRVILIVAMLSASAMAVCAQDLGSSNKLFGGPPKTSAPAKTSKPRPKTAAPKRRNLKTVTASIKTKPKAKLLSEKTAVKKTAPNKNSTTTATDKPTTIAKGKPVKFAATDPKLASSKKTQEKVSTERPVTVDDRFATFKSPEKPVTEATKKLFADLIRQGNNARDDRNYGRAETAYQKARALNVKDATALYGLGTIYTDQQRWEDAEASYRAALKLNPQDPVARVALSYVLTQPLSVDNLSDRYAEAETLAREAISIKDSSALASDQLGVALELRGLTGPETEGAYRRATQIDPNFAPAYAHLGRLLRRRGQIKDSKAAYQTAIDRSTNPSSLIVVAEIMQSEQRFTESEPLLKRAIDDDPKNAAALLLMGRALATENSLADAEIMFRRALDVSSNGYLPNSLLASLYLRQTKYTQAENALLQADRWVPDGDRRQLARQFEALGDAYLKTGNRTSAERSYRQAVRLDNKNESVATKLAKTFGS